MHWAPNVWTKKNNINVSELDFGKDFTGGDNVVKIHLPKEQENTVKLQNSLVIKVFGPNVPFHLICSELRRQWVQFGKFNLTILGLGWILCAFDEKDALDSVLTGGPWYVKNNIISMDKWSPSFSTSSLEWLTSSVWIRFPNLPLNCWDGINMCRITSMVGKPCMVDGNSFQWNRKEFDRVCVHINLDIKIPLGVWAEGSSGKFYQRIEYEKIPNFCFYCGKIGHFIEQCPEKVMKDSPPAQVENDVNNMGSTQNDGSFQGVNPNMNDYGPWIHVNFRRNKFKKQVPDPIINSQNNSISQSVTGDRRSKANLVYKNVEKKINVDPERQINEKRNCFADKEQEISGEDVNSVSHQEEGKNCLGMSDSIPIIPIDNNKFFLLNNLIEESEIVEPVIENSNASNGYEINNPLSMEEGDCDNNSELVKAPSSRKKCSKQLKSIGPIKLNLRSRRLEESLKEKWGILPSFLK
ncbi:hypothetical protein KFK09_022635 [Dendrobium nobile]|uniref:CCHC-type domain-containing protein n=1 Tax=Dendrobium nobile TaxID=94219 RepID=A0A8T3AJ17_DENNO|nr:hypothetical protein KFK09_022635 [Dendrobium nobile]